ncbi:MAG: hypothetical protein E7376_02165 [Clostridiales bacterium]|nr:hypothetical protein [Clostridiales bacterium]
MKKFITCFLAICLIVPFAFLLSGCGEQPPQNSVTLSVNPELTFVLDGNDNVLSISYGNSDAGTIFANVNFVGMNVDDAIQKFLEQSAISGHVYLSGDVVTVEVNGINEEKITALQNLAKTQVEEVFNNLGVTVEVNIAELTETARKQALIATAGLLAPEKTETELNEMTNEQLLKLINDKQKEYEGLVYSQIAEIQDEFSTAQNAALQAIQQAKAQVESLEQQINEMLEQYGDLIPDAIRTQIETTRQTIETQQRQIEEQVNSLLEVFKQTINNAKAQAEAAKAQLVQQFNAQVEATKVDFIAHLDAALANETLTQAQYDYWKALVENN